ncbi:MAG: hypothetical protein EA397_16060 [Deltaproteobacteria bacterium]|nr:MAG: hypothetical protein EA397_16060 [Deltaproteobacteria bacterium]
MSLSTTLAELDCEEERAERLAGALDDRSRRSQRGLTIAAITMGAITGVMSASLSLLGNQRAGEATALAGAGVEAGLGFAMLAPSRTTALRLDRNHLASLYEGQNQSGSFDPVVWSLITAPRTADGRSLRDDLVRRWEATWEPEQRAQLFGEFVELGPDGLYRRAQVIDEAEAEIGMLMANLSRLLASLERIPSPRRESAPSPSTQAPVPKLGPDPALTLPSGQRIARAPSSEPEDFGARFVGPSGYALRRVPPGTFGLGCEAGQAGCDVSATPEREVTLRRGLVSGWGRSKSVKASISTL